MICLKKAIHSECGIRRRGIMKARLVPVYFKNNMGGGMLEQTNILRQLLSQEAELLEPVELESDLPEAEAVVFPQLLGEAFKQLKTIKKIKLPILILTSEFGTMAMWDWEIVTTLKAEGLNVIAPYSLELAKTACRALGVKREMKQAKFLVFQDNPGDGMQAEIFKRFYWWEDSCTRDMFDKFGIRIVKKSLKQLAQNSSLITDSEAESIWSGWKSRIKTEGLQSKPILSAVKHYAAIKNVIENETNVIGVGTNCLNESFHCDTVPCPAWNMLFEEKGILWACEADTLSLLTECILYKSLSVPLMMTNLYPFLMGMAALKHEKINRFPDISEPEDHILAVHCGYFGFVPASFAEEC